MALKSVVFSYFDIVFECDDFMSNCKFFLFVCHAFQYLHFIQACKYSRLFSNNKKSEKISDLTVYQTCVNRKFFMSFMALNKTSR